MKSVCLRGVASVLGAALMCGVATAQDLPYGAPSLLPLPAMSHSQPAAQPFYGERLGPAGSPDRLARSSSAPSST